MLSCGCETPVDPMFRWPASGCPEADSLLVLFEHMRQTGNDSDMQRQIVDRMYDCGSQGKFRNRVMARAMYCDARIKLSRHRTGDFDRLRKAALVLIDSVEDTYDFYKWKALNRDSTSYENYRIQLEALGFFNSADDRREMACRYEYMGCMMLELDNRPRAHELFERAYSLFKAIGDTLEATKALMNIAVSSPPAYADSVLRTLLRHPSIISNNSYNIRVLVNYYTSTDSLRYLSEAIDICRRNPVDSIECLSLFYAYLGNYHTRHGNYDEGLRMLEKALSIMPQDYPADYQHCIYQGLADTYRKTGLFRESAMASEREDSLESILDDDARHSYLINADLRAEIEQLEKDRNLSEERMRWVYTSVILAIVLLTVIIIFLLYRRSKLRSMEALKAELRFKESRNKMLMASAVIEEKEKLIGELSQRLGHMSKDEPAVKEHAGEMLGIINRHNLDRAERECFLKVCENNDVTFESELRKAYPTLSERQIKIAAWIAAGVDSAQIARIFNIDHLSVNKARYRLKAKLGLSKDQNLDEFLRQFSHDH